ncbi:MAG TPA: protein kinase, partial [Candidatus Saccharimonadales bacterium]|nr:protein kinase [Candidatus Saccharimonadales bacterium]
VRGIKITDYCDQNNLSTEERLHLFTQVCQAIQHAHQKGIIHRDIKPSNILVSANDGVLVPKVIDFGIAKATQGRLTDQTLFTAFEQFIGTPAYMSPEQAVMTSLDIDTRSDIYSLGVLLYELLTGGTPFDAKELLAAGLDEMRHTIREKEPLKPSTRLGTMAADALTTTANHHHTDASKLIHLLRGDLDWIVMKSLDKDRARRYETANGLAMDIQRHLENEPVLARPPSRLYEFQKTVRRHKVGFAATAAILVALAGGVVVSTWEAIRAKRAERDQTRQRQQAERAGDTAKRQEQFARESADEAHRQQRLATTELWHSYLAQARALRFSGQPGRCFDSLDVLAKAAAIRFAPELRDEAIACLALPDLKLQRRIPANRGVFDRALERYATVATNFGNINISIRRVRDDQEVLLLPNPAGTVRKIALFSHDGKFLPVLCQDHLLRVWDLEHPAVVLTVPCGTRHATIDFEPGDRYVAVAVGAEISIYELTTGEKVNSFSTAFAPVCVRYDPSGRRLAISSFQDKRVAIMDPHSGATLMTLTNDGNAAELAWHPRDTVLAVPGLGKGLVYLWDTAAGRLLHSLKGHQRGSSNVEFSADGEMLISSGWDGMTLWNVRAGELLMEYGMSYGEAESFAPDGTAYGHSSYLNGPLELFSFASGRVARHWHAAEEDKGTKVVAFSWDGRWLAFGSGEFVKLFETRTGDLLATLSTGPLAGLCFQKSSGGLLVSGERGLFLWPMRAAGGAGELTIGPPEMVGSAGAWQQANIAENGRVFAAFHGDHACIFEAEGMREIARTAVCGREEQFRVVSVSPDGLTLATGGHHDTVVRIWNSRTGAPMKQLADREWLPEGGLVPAFGPTGRSLVVASYGSCRLWETDSWTPGLRVPRSDFDVPNLAMSHRSGLIALRSGQTSIELRDVATGEVLATLQSPIRSHVAQMAFSPDDTQLAVTYTGTRELLVWDVCLLREELKNLGLDWNRPPFPPVADKAEFKFTSITVLGKEFPLVPEPESPVK